MARSTAYGLTLARVRASRLALLGLAAVAALVAGSVGGTFAFIEQSSTHAVRTAPDLASGAAAVSRITTRLAPDPTVQDATVREIFREATGTAPVVLTRTLTTEALSVARADGAPLEQMVFSTTPDTHTQTTVDGAGEAGPGEALVPSDVAEVLGLSVGDTVTVAEVSLVVSGIWAPTDPESPAWALDPVLGATEAPFGPVVVDDETLLDVQDDPFVGWTLATRRAELTVADVTTLAAGLPSVRSAVNASAAQVRGVVETGALAETLSALDARASVARSVTAVPVALLLVVSLVALLQVARLLVSVRARETQILLARGASVSQLSRLALAESLPSAVLGASAGAAGAWTVLGAAGPAGRWSSLGMAWLVAAAGAVSLVVLLVVVGAAVAGARSISRAQTVDASGRGRMTIGAAAGVLLVAVSVLLVWRVWRAGRSTLPAAESLVVVAPGVLLLVLVLVVLLLLAPILRAVERRARRRPGLSPVLAARQVSRRALAFSVPAVLVALATGAAVLASGYAGTTDLLRGQVGGLVAGSDVRVQMPVTGTVTAFTTVPDLETVGSAASSLVLDVEGTVGDSGVRVLAIPAAQVAPLLVRTPAVEPGALAGLGAAGPALPGVALPAGTSTVVLGLSGGAVGLPPSTTHETRLFYREEPAVGGAPVPLSVTVWLADERGGIVRTDASAGSVPVAEADGGEVTTLAAELAVPETTTSWRVVAVELEAEPRRGPVELDLAVTSVEADGPAGPSTLGSPDASWRLLDRFPGSSAAPQDGVPGFSAPDGATLPAASGLLRVGPASAVLRFAAPDGTASGPAPVSDGLRVPAAVVPELLEMLDAEVGDQVDVTVAGQRVPVEIVGQTAAVPGGLAGPALVLDLDALHAFGLHDARAPVVADEVWLAADDVSDVDGLAAAVTSQVPEDWSVTSARTGADVPAVSTGTAFWIVAAAAAALALAGTWSVLGALGRERRGEVVALRSVGLSAAAQARSRASELVLVLTGALVAGLLAGAGVTAAVAGLLARVTVPEAFAGLGSDLHLGLAPLAVLLVLLVLGACGLVAGQAVTVRRQALDLDHREDAR